MPPVPTRVESREAPVGRAWRVLHSPRVSRCRDPEALVDDWERFFVEKSARRARRARVRDLVPMLLWVGAVGGAVAGIIAVVAR